MLAWTSLPQTIARRTGPARRGGAASPRDRRRRGRRADRERCVRHGQRRDRVGAGPGRARPAGSRGCWSAVSDSASPSRRCSTRRVELGRRGRDRGGAGRLGVRGRDAATGSGGRVIRGSGSGSADVRAVLTEPSPRTEPTGPWDAILLDVDNGPDFLIHADNAALYGSAALRSAYGRLTPGGVLAIWCQGAHAGLLGRAAGAVADRAGGAARRPARAAPDRVRHLHRPADPHL